MNVMEGYNLSRTGFNFDVNTFDKPDQYVEDPSQPVLAVKFDYAEHHRYSIYSPEDNIDTQVHHFIKKEAPHVSRFTLAKFKSDEDGEWKDYLYNGLDSLKVNEEIQDEIVDKIIEEFNKEIESLDSDNDRKILALSVDMKLTHYHVCQQDLIARELRKRMLKRVRVVKEEEVEKDQYQESRKRRKIIGENESCCSICLDEFVAEEDDVSCMPCSHVFHGKECIEKWLKENDSCPICRFQLHVC